MEKPTKQQLEELWETVTKFVADQKISGSETIHQCDRVIEHAYEFIEDCCEVVGYYEDMEQDV